MVTAIGHSHCRRDPGKNMDVITPTSAYITQGALDYGFGKDVDTREILQGKEALQQMVRHFELRWGFKKLNSSSHGSKIRMRTNACLDVVFEKTSIEHQSSTEPP